MTRQEFLKNISFGAAFVLTVPCLNSCKSDDDTNAMVPNPGAVNFTIDITDPLYSTPLEGRGWVAVNEVIVAKLTSGAYAAASQICSHEATKEVYYDKVADRWECTTHGALFDRSTGDPLNTVTDRPLRLYTTTLAGNMLTVRS